MSISDDIKIADYKKVFEWASSAVYTKNYTVPAASFALACLAIQVAPYATPFLFSITAPSGHVLSFFQMPLHCVLPNESFTQDTDWSHAVTDLAFIAIHLYKERKIESSVQNIFRSVDVLCYIDDDNRMRVTLAGNVHKTLAMHFVQSLSDLHDNVYISNCPRTKSEAINFTMTTPMISVFHPLAKWWKKPTACNSFVQCPVLGNTNTANMLVDRQKNALFRTASEPLKNIKLTCVVKKYNLRNTEWHHVVFCLAPLLSLYDFLVHDRYYTDVKPDYLTPIVEWLEPS